MYVVFVVGEGEDQPIYTNFSSLSTTLRNHSTFDLNTRPQCTTGQEYLSTFMFDGTLTSIMKDDKYSRLFFMLIC